MLWVNNEPGQDALYIRFQKDRLIGKTVWFADNATIDLGMDDSPIGVSVHAFYTQRNWPFTEEILSKFSLGSWADDLVTVRDAYFNPDAKLRYQGTKPK